MQIWRFHLSFRYSNGQHLPLHPSILPHPLIHSTVKSRKNYLVISAFQSLDLVIFYIYSNIFRACSESRSRELLPCFLKLCFFLFSLDFRSFLSSFSQRDLPLSHENKNPDLSFSSFTLNKTERKIQTERRTRIISAS